MKNSLHSITEKIKKFLVPHKIIAGVFVVLVLLLGITFLRSFAYYKADTKPDVIVNSKVGELPDIEIRIMQADSGTSGGYKKIDTIPESGYHYNTTKSYCAYNSTLTYDETSKSFTIEAEGTDLCFAYFDTGDAQSQ